MTDAVPGGPVGDRAGSDLSPCTPAWRGDEWLPRHDEARWSLLSHGRARHFEDERGLLARLRGWQPVQPILAAGPSDPRYVPPICIPQLAGTLRRHLALRLRAAGTVFALIPCIALALAVNARTLKSAEVFAACVALACAVILDARLLAAPTAALEDRARFMAWMQRSARGRRAAAGWLLCLAAMALAQWRLQVQSGGFEPLVRHYGAPYEAIRAGEYWRVLTGPLLHSGVVHFINNAVILLFVGTIASSMFGARAALAFVLGNIAGLVAQMTLGPATFDAYVGVSAGAFALFGMVAASGWLEPRRWPAGLTALCTWAAVFSVALSAVLSTRDATVAHLAGFATGVAWVALRRR